MKNRFMSKRTIVSIILIVLALFSIFGMSKIASSATVHSTTINALNEKQNTVMAITATAAASATAISAIPGDATSAIANQILNTSSYLFLVVCAIFLEKILITVFGYVSFAFIIPAACTLLIIYLYNDKKALRTVAIKLIIFAIALSMIIPFSVKISGLIETAHAETINSALQASETINALDEENASEKNWIEKVADKVVNFSKKALDVAKNTLSGFVNSVAMLMVTSILIPILAVFALIGIVKVLFGIQIHIPRRGLNRDKEKEISLIEQ